MKIHRIAAFSSGNTGGNPAGVVLLDSALPESEMARIAAEVGYSETVFTVPVDASNRKWRARYFSPESEVPFCGHATIALGSVLGQTVGVGKFELILNNADISVEAIQTAKGMQAKLLSPATKHQPLTNAELQEALNLFGLQTTDLDPRIAPARIHGGADHIVLSLHSRGTLAKMQYDLDQGRGLMARWGLVTIMLVFIETEQSFAARNAFASGGVLEDPATGASAAAFAGYLRELGWSYSGEITIKQGEDMGHLSIIKVDALAGKGSPASVYGETRAITL